MKISSVLVTLWSYFYLANARVVYHQEHTIRARALARLALASTTQQALKTLPEHATLDDAEVEDESVNSSEPTAATTSATPNCKPIVVLFARGASEPGNVGTLVGPPFFQALADQYGAENLAVHGVDYPSWGAKWEDRSWVGSWQRKLVDMVDSVKDRCGESRILLVGYSHGTGIVRGAVKLMSSKSAESSIDAVLLFGDPDHERKFPRLDAAKVHTICHEGDPACEEGRIEIFRPHLDYALDARPAAKWAKATMGEIPDSDLPAEELKGVGNRKIRSGVDWAKTLGLGMEEEVDVVTRLRLGKIGPTMRGKAPAKRSGRTRSGR